MQFKVGDKVRFKGRDEWTTVFKVMPDDGTGCTIVVSTQPAVSFPASSFTKQSFKSIHRVPFSCVILPLTMERIKKSAQSTKISEGKIIDQWASATHPLLDDEMAK